jgi:hypothetical protein
MYLLDFFFFLPKKKNKKEEEKKKIIISQLLDYTVLNSRLLVVLRGGEGKEEVK